MSAFRLQATTSLPGVLGETKATKTAVMQPAVSLAAMVHRTFFVHYQTALKWTARTVGLLQRIAVSLTPLAAPLQPALAASKFLLTSVSHNGIRKSKIVPVTTMSLVLQRMLSSTLVNPASDGFQVIGVYARRITAQVVQLKTFGNRTSVMNVESSVGQGLSVTTRFAVSSLIARSLPLPASRFGNDLVSSPGVDRSKVSIAGGAQPLVMLHAEVLNNSTPAIGFPDSALFLRHKFHYTVQGGVAW